MRISINFILIFFFVSAIGCLPAPERRVVMPPEPEVGTAPLLSTDILDEKIRIVYGILMEEGLSEEGKEIASDVLDAYMLLKEVLSSQPTQSDYRRVLHDLFQCLSLIDEKYFSKKQGRDPGYSRPISLFANKRTEVLDAYLSEDFKDVINQCLELQEVFGPDSLTPEIGLLFALSLAKEGMLEDALDIGEGITHEIEVSPDIIHLRAKIAEWQLSLGHRENALHTYDKLTDNLDERESIIRELHKRIVKAPRRDTLREKILVEHPAARDEHMEVQDRSSMDQLLGEVDTLVLRHDFNEAKLLLIRHKIWVEEGPESEIIDQALNDLELAEEEFEREKTSEHEYGIETLEMVKKLIEEEKFEEAIARLEDLKESQEISTESKALKEQATERLINSERNRAAKLFLKAKDTKDPVRKEEYLRSSHIILKVLIDEYPISPLNIKIKSHMKIVMEELDKLGKGVGR